MTNPDDPAFKPETVDPKTVDPSVSMSYPSGLTKREYFAALAMQGLLASGIGVVHKGLRSRAFVAISLGAVSYADAMLAELNRG